MARTVEQADLLLEHLIVNVKRIAVLQGNKDVYRHHFTGPSEWSLDSSRMREELAKKAAWYESVTGQKLYSPAMEQVEAQQVEAQQAEAQQVDAPQLGAKQAWYSFLFCRLFYAKGCSGRGEDQVSLLHGTGEEQGIHGDLANDKKLR